MTGAKQQEQTVAEIEADSESVRMAREHFVKLPPTWVLQGRSGEVCVRASSGMDFRFRGTITSMSQFGLVLEGGLVAEDQVSTYFIPWGSICFFKEKNVDAKKCKVDP